MSNERARAISGTIAQGENEREASRSPVKHKQSKYNLLGNSSNENVTDCSALQFIIDLLRRTFLGGHEKGPGCDVNQRAYCCADGVKVSICIPGI